MPRVKRPRIAPFLSPPPGIRSFFEDLIAYSNRKKRVYAAYTVVTLCRFGRWLSWALFPAYRFFPALTDSVDGAMSWEMKAQLSLRPNPNLPFLMALPVIGIGLAASKAAKVKKGA